MKATTVLSLAALVLVGGADGARAQQPRRDWEPRGFDFTPDGVWRLQARRVAELRRQALARGDFALLNQAIATARRSPGVMPGSFQMISAAGAGAAVSGILRIPALLVRFKGSTPAHDTAQYDSVLFGTGSSRLTGRPYSVRTFYEELSHGLMSVQGVVVGWIQLDSAESWYAGSGTCDGLCGSGHMAQLIQEAVRHADSTVNFAQFDSAGTGQVPLLWLIKPTIGAECGKDGVIWAHRFYYSGWTGTTLATRDAVIGGSGFEQINNYTIQSGLGGATACDTSGIMPPGTIAHETGHGLNLPDLYDVGLTSEGIGHWGLMGSGNYARPYSPAHMEAWSLSQLGWVSLAPLAHDTSVAALSPVETSDTVAVIRPPAGVANPRGEYWMLETRRALNADSGLVNRDGNGIGGLLVWHVDSAKVALCGLPNNCVNQNAPHGVELAQADGLGELDAALNRGNYGDPYPGATGNTSYSYDTNPAAVLNTTGAPFAGFALDSIRSPSGSSGPVAFHLRFFDLVVAIKGPGSVSSSPPMNLTAGGMATPGSLVTLVAAPGAGQVFGGWTGDTNATSDTLIVTMSHQYRLTAAFGTPLVVSDSSLAPAVVGVGYADTLRVSGATGAYTFGVAAGSLPRGLALSPAGVISGVPAKDSSFSAVVRATAASWLPTVNIPVALTVTAPTLVLDSVIGQYLLGGSRLTPDQLRYLDLNGNQNSLFDIGDVVAWLDKTGQSRSAVMSRLLRRLR